MNVSSLLTAGMLPDEDVKVFWEVDGNNLRVIGTGSKFTEIGRDFYATSRGWEVEHVYFTVLEKYQGTGNAKRMMRGSLEAYDALGISRLNVSAVDVGGYAWARAGFVNANEDHARKLVLIGARQLDGSDIPIVHQTIASSSPGELMFDLAKMRRPDHSHLGKEFLRNFSWRGFIDLANSTHRDRVALCLGDLT